MLPKRRYGPRLHYTAADKALMWDSWQQGESLHAIAGDSLANSYFNCDLK
jgi:hypothetical protein